MYLDASLSLKQALARITVVEDERDQITKRLAVVEKRLKESTGRSFCGGVAGDIHIPTTHFAAISPLPGYPNRN